METETDPPPPADSNGSDGTHLHAVAARMSALRKNALTHVEPVLKNFTAAMSRHPFATVAVGLGLGFVISRLRRP